MASVSRWGMMLMVGLTAWAMPAAVGGGFEASASPQEASPWQQGFHSRARLISGGADLAGIEIVLDPGYKTYWRQPGDSGLPPRFDWTGSENITATEIAWPAPTRSEDAGGVAYGYHDRVVFPVRLRVQNPGKAVRLRLAVEYGVCKEICIPARAETTLTLDRTGPHRRAVEAALARVPKPQMKDAAGPLAILAVEPVPGGKPSYRVKVRAPGNAALFAEGPENWYLSTTAVLDDSATVTVEEKPKEASAGLLKLTLVAGQDAIETEVPLDGIERPR